MCSAQQLPVDALMPSLLMTITVHHAHWPCHAPCADITAKHASLIGSAALRCCIHYVRCIKMEALCPTRRGTESLKSYLHISMMTYIYRIYLEEQMQHFHMASATAPGCSSRS